MTQVVTTFIKATHTVAKLIVTTEIVETLIILTITLFLPTLTLQVNFNSKSLIIAILGDSKTKFCCDSNRHIFIRYDSNDKDLNGRISTYCNS